MQNDMGTNCCKEEQCDDIPAEDIIAPYTIIKSKEEIAYSPNAIFIGVYQVEDLLVYVYSLPQTNYQPNKFLIASKVIEVLCENPNLDINMIMKQVRHIRRNYLQNFIV